MAGRSRRYAVVLGAAAAVAVVARHVRGTPFGRRAAGGIPIGDALVYDRATRLLFGGFFDDVASDIAAAAPSGARVLEVGCGPGHLSARLARDHGLRVTGLDLDPAMIRRARANAGRWGAGVDLGPSFVVGDVASLALPDGSFDLAVSTFSMHHWADPAGGLAEIGRVLRPGGRAVVWDLRPGVVPFHGTVPDPVRLPTPPLLRLEHAGPWRWPRRWPRGLALLQRIELVRIAQDDGTDGERGAP